MADDVVFGVFVLVVIATAGSILLAVRRRRWSLLYWIVSAFVFLQGLIAMAWTIIDPPQYFDADGNLIGEIPPELAGAAMIATAGLLMALAGVVVVLAGLLIKALLRSRRSRHVSLRR